MSFAHRAPRFLLAALLLSLPFDRIPSLNFEPFNITVRLSLVLGGLLILTSFPLLMRHLRSLIRSPWVFLLLFNVMTALSITGATDKSRAVAVCVFTLFVSVLSWVVALQFNPTHIPAYRHLVYAAAMLVGVFALYQFFGDLLGLSTHLTGLRAAYTKAVFGFPRIQAASLEPLYFADFLLIPLGLLLAEVVLSRRYRLSILLTGILTLIWLTLSRGAFGALIIMIPISLIIAGASRHWKALGLTLLSTAVSLTLAVGLIALAAHLDIAHKQANTLQQFTSQATNVDSGLSAIDRGTARHLALQAFKQHPLHGLGGGNFGLYAFKHAPSKFTHDSIVNNEPLELAAETGIFGLLAIVAFALATGVRAVHTSLTATEPTRSFTLGLLLALIGIAVQYQTFSTLYITHIWVAIGLLIGATGAARVSSARKA